MSIWKNLLAMVIGIILISGAIASLFGLVMICKLVLMRLAIAVGWSPDDWWAAMFIIMTAWSLAFCGYQVGKDLIR